MSDLSPSSTQATSATATPEKKYKVEVIRDKCIGAGSCVAIAPGTFNLDAEGKAIVIGDAELDDIKLLSAQSCPTAAIIVTNIETGERVWPR